MVTAYYKKIIIMAKHQIAYYIIEYRYEDNTIGNLAEMLNRVLTYINGLDKVQRKRNGFFNHDKFAYLSDFSNINNVFKVIMKSASHSYSAPLIHKDTLSEPKNPKKLEEGEQVKTHIVIDANSRYATKDTMYRGIAMNAFICYVNSFLDDIYNNGEIKGMFVYSDVPSDNFKDEIDRLDRVSLAEITTDKQILGSPALGYNDRMEEVHEDVNITIKAKRGGSIKERVLSTILPSLNNNKIHRIKIKGKDEVGNNCILDSLNLLKKSCVEVEKNEETGEFESDSMFAQLMSSLPIMQ